MKLSHFFLPHPQTHKKAQLLSLGALSVYLALFIVLQMALPILGYFKPGILGISGNISAQDLIRLTNEERQRQGLPTLNEDSRLAAAALAKGQNMFEENYWAHFSPSGKDPWGFISSSGYRFVYAGENLARNFYSPQDVVSAWMASPTHRDNIVNSKYRDIGIAVLEGTLNGQPTILIVQEFGAQFEAIAQGAPQVNSVVATPVPTQNPTLSPTPTPPAPTLSPSPLLSPSPSFSSTPSIPPLIASVEPPKNKGLIDSYLVKRNLGVGALTFLASLILIDLYIVRRRGIFAVTSRHLPHLALMAVAASTLLNYSPGQIL